MDIDYIKKVLEADIERLGCRVWGLELFGRSSNQTLRIFIDKTEGISVEDCEKVSKHVSKVLDTENDFSENYMLEVSSPGLDRKFFYNEQYKDYLNEPLKVTFFDSQNKKTIQTNKNQNTRARGSQKIFLFFFSKQSNQIPFSNQ